MDANCFLICLFVLCFVYVHPHQGNGHKIRYYGKYVRSEHQQYKSSEPINNSHEQVKLLNKHYYQKHQLQPDPVPTPQYQLPQTNPASSSQYKLPPTNPASSQYQLPPTNPASSSQYKLPPTNPASSQYQLPQTNPAFSQYQLPQTNPASSQYQLPPTNPASSQYQLPQTNPASSQYQLPPTNPAHKPQYQQPPTLQCSSMLAHVPRQSPTSFDTERHEPKRDRAHSLRSLSPDVMIFQHPETELATRTGIIKAPVLAQRIEYDTVCPDMSKTRFRPIDGKCSHPENLGASFTPLARELPAQYGNANDAPRTRGTDGLPLSSARIVSRTVHPDMNITSNFTIMLMQWGQLIDHEMVSTLMPMEDQRENNTCCGPDNSLPTGIENPECFPILFKNDPFFKGRCMFFIRSQPARDKNGNILRPRENINGVTAYIDASVAYGSTQERLDELRTEEGRGMFFRLDRGRPVNNGLEDCILGPNPRDFCYLAGDDRVNEQVGLTAVHTILMRKHNQWAEELSKLNPYLSQEEVFQKVRALIIAVEQKIFFNDYLPIILGEKIAIETGIFCPQGGRTRFDPDFKPAIFSGFATAAFRFGHSLIPRELFLGNPDGSRSLLRDLFFKPYLLFEFFEEIFTNLINIRTDEDKAQTTDRFFTKEVSERLFENSEAPFRGFDLVSLNIQRGRDHGIPSYNDFRAKICGLPRVTSFKDPCLGTAGERLAVVYNDPDDIELFPGGISEPRFEGGILGETFNCLISRQMQRLKYGDRFFFTHYRGDLGFDNRQLGEIYNYTLSQLMCETTAMDVTQLDAFKQPSPDNTIVHCDSYRPLDIAAFAWP